MKRPKKSTRRTPVHLTQRALRDIQSIADYSLEQWGRAVAEKYLDGISAGLDRIEANPAFLRLEPELAAGVYFYRVAMHVFVCDYQKDRITVLTLLHTNMDIPARLSELMPQLTVEAQMLQSILSKQRN